MYKNTKKKVSAAVKNILWVKQKLRFATNDLFVGVFSSLMYEMWERLVWNVHEQCTTSHMILSGRTCVVSSELPKPEIPTFDWPVLQKSNGIQNAINHNAFS